MKDLLLGVALLLTAICCILIARSSPAWSSCCWAGCSCPPIALAFCLKGYPEYSSQDKSQKPQTSWTATVK